MDEALMVAYTFATIDKLNTDKELTKLRRQVRALRKIVKWLADEPAVQFESGSVELDFTMAELRFAKKIYDLTGEYDAANA